MLTSLSLIFLVGLTMAGICRRIRIPGILGMLLTGIILGPFVLDFLDSSILGISSELRQIALIICQKQRYRLPLGPFRFPLVFPVATAFFLLSVMFGTGTATGRISFMRL